MSRKIQYCIHREGKHYVAQCLNVDVSSFGESSEEAAKNLMEAVELYFEDEPAPQYQEVEEVTVGEGVLRG